MEFNFHALGYVTRAHLLSRTIHFSASQSETSESVPQQQVGVQGDSDLTLGANSSGNTLDVQSLDPDAINALQQDSANADNNVAGVATAAVQAVTQGASNAENDVVAASTADESNALGFATNTVTQNYMALENNTSEAFGTIDALVAEQASGSQQALLDAENADNAMAFQSQEGGAIVEPINSQAPINTFRGNGGNGGGSGGISTTDIVTIGSVVTIGLAAIAFLHSKGNSS